MYFIPAFLARLTISSALNFMGLNCGASCSYSATGILRPVHYPFTDARNKLALPLTGGDGVKPPVNKHPETRFAKPLQPLFL
jgi:hypothetical protein